MKAIATRIFALFAWPVIAVCMWPAVVINGLTVYKTDRGFGIKIRD